MLRRAREWYGGFAIIWANACLLFFAVNLVLAVVHRRAPQPLVLGPMRTPIANAYPDLDAAALDVLVAESNRTLAYAPYTDMTDPPVTGRFVNIDPAGFRKSKDQGPWPPDPRNSNVFLFGGSTTFGYGVADDHTIASFLQPLLRAADGRPTRVYNFGHSGYYSTQERILFEQLVVAGFRPDVAIFVDGLNDFAATRDEPMTAARLDSAFRMAEESPLQAAVRALPVTTTALHLRRSLGLATPPEHVVPETPPAYDDEAYLNAVIDRYRRSKRAIEGIATAYGIRTVFVWQPVPSYHFPPGGSGWWLGGGGANGWARYGFPLMARAVDAATLGGDFVWCADAAADGTAVFYVDVVHYAPVLSARVARCIAEGMLGRASPPPSAPR